MAWVVIACVLQLNNPYHLWCVWRSDVRHANACIEAHNRWMDEKVARLIKSPPPEHTIAGMATIAAIQ
jgi:hypothetical protein